MICVSITEATNEKALRAVERSVLAADAIELRMDLINDGDLPQLIAKARRGSDKVKIIVTSRRKEEALLPASYDTKARKKQLTATAKMNLLKQAITLGADFIDVELACGEKTIRRLQSFGRRRKSPTEVIVSWHDISKTPSLKALREIFQACAGMEPDIVKMVTYARKASDNLKVLSLIPYAKDRKRKIIAMCMGEEGKISRIMAPLMGSYLGFAVLPEGKPSAPGQLTVHAMRVSGRLLEDDARKISPSMVEQGAQNFVLLGNPVGQSLSPLMHNAALQAMRIDGRYSAFCVSDIGAALAAVRGMNIRGASVTIPFKTAVMEYLDDIDPDAIALGAVNTIVNDRGCLAGYNTDWLGLMQSLKDQMSLEGKTFVIIGAGGTARAAAYGLQKEGGIPIIVNRTEEKGRALAARFDCPFYPLSAIDKVRADGLINTTSVGMVPYKDQSPVAKAILADYPLVVDVIYNPLKTRLLLDAEAKGCRIISGLEMFVYQGAGQFKLWTGKEAPLALMKKIVREESEKRESRN